jgi:phosphatidylserine decarboxylase
VAERLAAAWRDTPTKWYPLPLGTGLLLLLALQARKKWEESPGASHDGASVHVDDEGREVVRLKGPWQVRALSSLHLPRAHIAPRRAGARPRRAPAP